MCAWSLRERRSQKARGSVSESNNGNTNDRKSSTNFLPAFPAFVVSAAVLYYAREDRERERENSQEILLKRSTRISISSHGYVGLTVSQTLSLSSFFSLSKHFVSDTIFHVVVILFTSFEYLMVIYVFRLEHCFNIKRCDRARSKDHRTRNPCRTGHILWFFSLKRNSFETNLR